MFVFGVVLWLISCVTWLVLIINPTTRDAGLHWFPLVTMWIGNALMWINE